MTPIQPIAARPESRATAWADELAREWCADSAPAQPLPSIPTPLVTTQPTAAHAAEKETLS